jgi:hypothetical protein
MNVVHFLKENLLHLQEDHKKLSDDYSLLKRRIENLTNLQNRKSSDDLRDKENQSSKQLLYDNSNNKYVEITIFNEFKTQVQKEIDNLKFSINDLKSTIDEILNRLKTKSDEKDLKDLELYLLNKLEELKSACNKKFADKNETAKNLKYLDSQIKQLIEINIKRMDKGDNWLLAKKPLEGFSCASCEAFIGDLKENNEYIPWNKYPMRDPSDKLYRMGSGFSKMLQYMNIEGYMNSTGNNNMNMNVNVSNANPNGVLNKKNQTSQDFFKRPNPMVGHGAHGAHGSNDINDKRDMHLPKVKTNKKNMNNMSADDIEIQNDDGVEDPKQPKM